ncbi:uncharacterized protein LOC117116164 [Anneissia japonica]|uniref:uncharacterized protein LOC117116164 n=1 Tax=Anneissia japonica TaxID=1529436 RepID=UPI0014256E58|nr:uncharacterized protein LOC117116164 [Anneissia japonica]
MTGGDYFTHPDHMRGATRQKQNVMMHKQLAHFEKCVKDLKGTYFSPTHNNMLRDLVPSNVIVTSLAVLRELVKRDISRQHKKGIDINDNELVKHFDDFFQMIAYLRRLKRDFTDKIYSVLFEFFYPIALNDVPDMIGKGGKRMSKVKSDNLSIIKNNSEPTDDEEEIEYEMTEELIIQCNEMRDIIESLHHVNYRWEKLMASDEIDANFFDAETLQELRLYDSSKNFEYMLRLVPDIINKSLRAVELARKWWFNSDKFCKKLEQFKKEMAQMPRRRRPLVVIPESELNNCEHSNDEDVEDESPQIEIQDVDRIERRRSERHKEAEATNYRNGRKKAEAASKHWLQKAVSHRDERSQEVVARNRPIEYGEDESHQETAAIKYQNKRHQKVVPNIESNDDIDDELEFSYKEDEEESQISSSDKESKHFTVSKSENDNNIDESIIQLENSLKQVIARIGTLEEELLKQNTELHGLQKRQSRIDDLSSDVENAKDIKDNVYFKLKDLKNTKDELLKKISRSKNGSLLHTELKKTLASTEEDIMELKNAAKLHEFHHELLTSDLDVEMEMRPTLTGYSQHLQSKILEMERTLAAEMVRKHVLEKRLIIAKANLQHTIKEDQPPPEINAQPKFPSEQMYVYQSGLRNPPSIKPPRITKPRAESNHSGTEHTDVNSPAIYIKPKKKTKSRPPRNNGSFTAPTLPELTPHGHVMTKSKVPGRKSRKPLKPDANWKNPELQSSQSNENVSVQYSDATSNADVPSSPENHRKQGKRRPNKKDVKHNVLYTPQNGGRYRKSSGNRGRPHVTDRRTSTSDDGDTNFKQGLSDYSVEVSSRKEYKNKNIEKLNSTYRVEPHRQRETYLPSKQVEVLDKVNNSNRKQRIHNKRQKQRLSDESDEGVYKSKDKKIQPRGKHNTSRYLKNKQVDDRQKQQETPFSFDDDDALSIPEDPDAGSSESNDSDFSEELKAKQQKLRELRHRQEASNKRTSYDRPQRKPDRQPKAYDSKRDKNRREYQHYDTTPPPPPGYHEKRTRIPVKHY